MKIGTEEFRKVVNAIRSDAGLSPSDLSLLSEIQRDLDETDPNRRLGGAHAGPALAAGPAAAVAVPIAAIGISLNVILAILVALAAALLLALVLDRYASRIFATIAAMASALAEEAIALRNRVREYQRDHGNLCDPQFNALIAAINAFVTRLNSPGLSRANPRQLIRAIGPLLQAIATAMLNYIRCLDPTDTLGLIDKFLRPNGKLMRYLRRLLNQ